MTNRINEEILATTMDIGVGIDCPPAPAKDPEAPPRWFDIWVDDARQNVLIAFALIRRKRSIIRLPFGLAYTVYFALGNAVARLADPGRAVAQRRELKGAIFASAFRPYWRGSVVETDPATGDIALVLAEPFRASLVVAFRADDIDSLIEHLIAARYLTGRQSDDSVH